MILGDKLMATEQIKETLGIDIYQGVLKPGVSPVWQKTSSGKLALTAHQTNTSPNLAVFPAVNIYCKCSIPEGGWDENKWPYPYGGGGFYQKSGIRIESDAGEIRFKFLGIFTPEDLLDAENLAIAEGKFMRQARSRYDGCSYSKAYEMPLPVLFKKAIESLRTE
jgi:hypothetical protein